LIATAGEIAKHAGDVGTGVASILVRKICPYMPARLHSLVQHAKDFYQSGLGHAIVEDVHRIPDLQFGNVRMGIADVKTTDAV
jgi:hypothetical protein